MGRFAKKDNLFDVIFKKAEKILMFFIYLLGRENQNRISCLGARPSS